MLVHYSTSVRCLGFRSSHRRRVVPPRLDRLRILRTVFKVQASPSHGFPGGPPNPPYGDLRVKPQPTPSPEMPPPPPQVEPHVENLADPVVEPKAPRRLLRKLAIPLASVLVVTAAGAFYLRISRPAEPQPTTPATTTPVEPQTPTQPPITASVPGEGTFAPVSVDDCSTMLTPIGATNPFPAGAKFDPAAGFQIEASGALTTPTWFINLPEDFPARSLSSQSRPTDGKLDGISDGTVLLFAPLDPANETLLGVYRVANGELVWSTKLPREVYPMSDSKNLYLIDRRSPSATTVAVISPSRAQILNCFAAAGSPLPTPNPLDRTATAFDGSLYVTFDTGSGSTIEALSESGSRSIASNQPYPLALHGVLQDGDRRVLLGSNGSQGDFSLFGYDVVTSASPFEVPATQIAAAPVAEILNTAVDQDVAKIASPGAAVTLFELRSALASGSRASLLFGTNTQDLYLAVVDIDGNILWGLPVRPTVDGAVSVTPKTVQVSNSQMASGTGARVALVLDIESGKLLSKIDNLRWFAGLGTEYIMHSFWATETNRNVRVFKDDKEFAGIGGNTASTVEPLASSPVALTVYAEVSGRRVVVTYVLDPNAVEAPTS